MDNRRLKLCIYSDTHARVRRRLVREVGLHAPLLESLRVYGCSRQGGEGTLELPPGCWPCMHTLHIFRSGLSYGEVEAMLAAAGPRLQTLKLCVEFSTAQLLDRAFRIIHGSEVGKRYI